MRTVSLRESFIHVFRLEFVNLVVVVFLVSPKETAVIVDPSGPILEDSSVSLSCSSRSNPPVTNYTWYRDDEVHQETGPILKIEDINPSFSGDYHCTAENSLGEETSAKVHLDVQCEFVLHRGVLCWRCCYCWSSCDNPDMICSQEDDSVWTSDRELLSCCMTAFKIPSVLTVHHAEVLCVPVCLLMCSCLSASWRTCDFCILQVIVVTV